MTTLTIFWEFLRTDFVLALRGRIGVFWTILFPAALLVLQMTLFGGGKGLGPVQLTIADLDHTSQSARYVQFVKTALGQQTSVKFNVRVLTVAAPANAELALEIPAGFAQRAGAGATAGVTWRSTLQDRILLKTASGLLWGITDSYNIDVSGAPRAVKINFMTALDGGGAPAYIMYLVTGLAGMIILSASLMDFGLTVVTAREGGMFKLYQILPIRPVMILLVWWTSRLIISLAASLLMFIIAWVLYDLHIAARPLQVAAALCLLILGTGAFLSIGLLIASFSKTTMGATMAANMLYFPLLFTGNVLLPLGSLPKALRDIMDRLPLNALLSSLRAMLSGAAEPSQVGYTVVMLCALTIISISLSVRKFDWQPQS